MTRICAKCGSQSIIRDYDSCRHAEYEKCQMCGGEKFKEKEIVRSTTMSSKKHFEPVLSSNEGPSLFETLEKLKLPDYRETIIDEEPMNRLPDEKIELIEQEIRTGTSARKIAKKAGIDKNTARKYIKEHYEKTGERRPENRGGSGRKPENEGKPRPKCKVECCDKWPVSMGLCTHHWSLEYRVGFRKGVPVALPAKEEDKTMGHKICKAEGCNKHAHVEGVCDRHYKEIHGYSYKPKNKMGSRATRTVTKYVRAHEHEMVARVTDTFAKRMEGLLIEFKKEAEKWQKAVDALELILKDVAA